MDELLRPLESLRIFALTFKCNLDFSTAHRYNTFESYV